MSLERRPAGADVIQAAPTRADDSCCAPEAGTLSARDVLFRVFASPGYRVTFALVTAVVTLLYSILLPFEYTQRFGLGNWAYLTAYLGAWSIVLGLGMGVVMTVQVYALRQVAAARTGTMTGLAFVASVLPSMLCCTPIIPSLLAFVGLSAVSVYGTTGTLQHFFAVHQTQFLAASLILLGLTGYWGARQVSRASCLDSEGCATGVDGPGYGAGRTQPEAVQLSGALAGGKDS